MKKDKSEKDASILDVYGQNVLAKGIWNIFNPILPTLYNLDKDEYVEWEKFLIKILNNYQ